MLYYSKYIGNNRNSRWIMRLEINGITKRFGRTVALDNVTFALTEPGIYGFVGPNGSGKTTLLRILAGFDDADSGDAVIDGVSRLEYPEQFRRRIGFMPDTLPNSRDIIVKDYIDFYARAFLKGEARQQKFREVCELTQLDVMLDKPLFALSKGMKQRVLLARLLIHDPELMLLDEPAAGLDPRARVELRDNLLELARRGKTILLSSHILGELEDMISGLVILEQGKLISAGKFGGAVNNEELPPLEELVLTPAPGTELENVWTARLKEIPDVEQCVVTHNGRRQTLTLMLKRGSFEEVLPAIVKTGFPLAALRRPELAPDLEKIFLAQTTGGVQ